MGAKGKPKTKNSGRKKGTPNKSLSPVKERAQALGIDPFEVLLLFSAGDWKKLGYDAEKQTIYSKDVVNTEYTIQPAVRAKCAAAACEYLYPKLKAVEHSGTVPSNVPQQVVILPSNGYETAISIPKKKIPESEN